MLAAEGDQFVAVSGPGATPGMSLDGGLDLLAKVGVGDAKHCGIGDPWGCVIQQVLRTPAGRC